MSSATAPTPNQSPAAVGPSVESTGPAERSSGNPFTEAVAACDRYFFAPRETKLLGLLRWATGLMLVYTHLVWGLSLEAFFSDDGWLPRENVLDYHRSAAEWSFWFVVPDAWLWPVHVVCCVLLALFAVGLFTRVTAWIAFAIVVSYTHRVPTALFGLDQINGMLTLYLAVAYLAVPGASRAFSLDRWLATRGQSEPSPVRPSWSANLGLRLIQIHMCVIYTFAGLGKLLGVSWWDGSAMWRTVSNLEYQTIDMTWIAHHTWMSDVMTHVTAVWELTFWALVWRPFWRWPVLATAVVVHLGIGAAMGMMTFGLIMLVGCASFLPYDEAVES